MTDTVTYGDIVCTNHAARVVVGHAPDHALIGLGAIERLHVSGDRLWLGETPDGHAVVYRVTGWNPEAAALTVERVEPAEAPQRPVQAAGHPDPCAEADTAPSDRHSSQTDPQHGGPWTRHGHPIPGITVIGSTRPSIGRCGGPALCTACRDDEQHIRATHDTRP